MSRKTKTRRTIAVSKQPSSSQTSLFLYWVALREALLLALERKREAMKKHGRELTDRALQQWANSAKSNGAMAQVRVLVREAKRKAKRFRPNDKTQLATLMYGILHKDLILEQLPKRRGAKLKRKRGLIKLAMSDNPTIIASKRPRHRPPLFELPTEANRAPAERLFFDYSLGCKARIYKNNRWRSAGLDYIVRNCEGNLETLDKMVSEREVAKDIYAQCLEDKELSARFKINPDTSIEAILGRIRRARKRHAKSSYTLNLYKISQKADKKTVKKKSGG